MPGLYEAFWQGRMIPRMILFWISCLSPWLGAQSHLTVERISKEEGISHPSILCLMQDKKGFIWVGTQYGLNRFDGYRFTTYRRELGNAHSLSDNFISALCEDSDGFIWVGTQNGGLNRFNPRTLRFNNYQHIEGDANSLSHVDVRSILEDSQRRLWVGTHRGLNVFLPDQSHFNVPGEGTQAHQVLAELEVLTLKEGPKGRVWIGSGNGLYVWDESNQQLDQIALPQTLTGKVEIHALAFTGQERLWVGTWGQGVHVLNLQTMNFDPNAGLHPSTNNLAHSQVASIEFDGQEHLWIGTLGGLTRVNLTTGVTQSFEHDPQDPYSLSQNWVKSLLVDQTGLLWIGTNISGLNSYDPMTAQFLTFRAEVGGENELPNNRIRALTKASGKGLWVSAFGGGLRTFDFQSQTFQLPRDKNGTVLDLDTKLIIAMLEDDQAGLWLATFDDGLRYWNRETGALIAYRAQDNLENGLITNNILTLFLEDNRTLWVGTEGGGLNAFDIETNTWQRFNHSEHAAQSLSADSVQAIYKDRFGLLWIGTRGGGVNLYDPQAGTFKIYQHDPDKPKSIPHNSTAIFFEAKNGEFWVGTQGGGLCKVIRDTDDASNVSFEIYSTREGLAADAIGGILEDSSDNLWISTILGISKLNQTTKLIENFEAEDGTQPDGYYIGSAYQATNGMAYFGGLEGMTVFNPDHISKRTQMAPVVFTDFLLNNQSVPLRSEDKDSPLTVPIEDTRHITLNHRQKIFAFEFASLHFSGSMENRYAYQLDGFDDDWVISNADKRFAAYTNLPSGDYVFRVKSGNRNGDWYQDQASVSLKILPPPWLTWWAYTIYGLLLLGSLGLYLFIHEKRLKAQRRINEKLRTMDRLKDEFLANTSHELRTPLNGIIGLTESLIDGAGGPLKPKVGHDLTMVAASARRLSHLVNDILDFTKLKNRDIVLNQKIIDMHALTDIALNMQKPLLAKKPLRLQNKIPKALPAVSGDENRILQILHNLVGNAIKFTESGTIEVSALRNNKWAEVTVSDSGIGIPEEKQEAIFGAFEQLEGSETRQQGGTGLGLAITKRLVALHGGTIWVDSKPGEGTRMTFRLPFAGEREMPVLGDGPGKSVPKEPEILDAVLDVTPPAVVPEHTRFKILVVDDDPVNRQVLVNHLSMQNYELVEVTCGADALAMVKRDPTIDLVLLDLMMPQMSGYEVCKRLREIKMVSELPVIFLTAKDQLADLVSAFEAGANDYLTKPITKVELLARVKMHLQLLDTHRHLEEKVAERTEELQGLNKTLRANHIELEALDHLVGSINRESSLKPMAEVLTKEGLLAFSVAHTSAFILRDKDRDEFRVEACCGIDLELLKHVTFTQDEMENRYFGSEPLLEGIWLLRNLGDLPISKQLEGIPLPEVAMAMTVSFDDVLQCVYVLSNLEDETAFNELDIARFKRFREHLISAISKANYLHHLERTTIELRATQDELVRSAHQAGMTEIVINVLHEIGNTLNHINTSAEVLDDLVDPVMFGRLLRRVVLLLEDNAHQLPAFFEQNPRAKQLPNMLGEVEKSLISHGNELQLEVQELKDGIQKIMGILQAQQELAEGEGLFELVDLNAFLDTSLKHIETAKTFFAFEIQRNYDQVPRVEILKRKLVQVMTHLMVNAQEAFARNQTSHPLISIKTRLIKGEVVATICDNAGGIPADLQSTVFNQGFTTKTGGRGLGLHFCANVMTEMNGKIHLTSHGKTTEINLSFPVKPYLKA